jgi:hypothetical protein
MPVFLNTADAGFEAAFQTLLGQKREEAEDVDQAVAQIIADVRSAGRSGRDRPDPTLRPPDADTRNARLLPRRNRRRNRQGHPRGPRRPGPRRRPHPRLPHPPEAAGRKLDRQRRRHARLALDAGLGGGPLRPRRARLLPVLGADERDPRQGRRRRTPGHRLPDTRTAA